MEFDLEKQNTLKISLDQPAKKRSWILLVVLIIIVVLVILKVSSFIIIKQKIKQEKNHCQTMRAFGNIFILLYNHDQSKHTAETILSAYRSAYCKKQIYVGVYQELSTREADVYDYLVSFASTDEELHFINTHVGIVSVDNTTVGQLWSMKELINRDIFEDMKWCFIVFPGGYFDVFWDKTLMDDYYSIKSDKPFVLTSMVNKIKQVKQYNRRGNIFSEWLNNLIGQGQQYLKKQKTHSWHFPIVTDFQGYIPILSKQRYSQPPRECNEVLAITSKCLFMSMEQMQDLIQLNIFEKPIASYANDTVLSAMLWMDDNKFFQTHPIIQEKYPSKSLRPDNWNGKEVSLLLQDQYGEYFDFLGLDMKKREVSGRAMLGILPDENLEDIRVKYGSIAEYERVQRSLHIKR